MIIDGELFFSNRQAITASGNTYSEKVIDLGAGGAAIGQEPSIVAVVNEAFVGSGNLSIYVETSDNQTTWTQLHRAQALNAAALAKGAKVMDIRLMKDLKRYMRILYSTSAAFTAGKISVFVAKEV